MIVLWTCSVVQVDLCTRHKEFNTALAKVSHATNPPIANALWSEMLVQGELKQNNAGSDSEWAGAHLAHDLEWSQAGMCQ